MENRRGEKSSNCDLRPPDPPGDRLSFSAGADGKNAENKYFHLTITTAGITVWTGRPDPIDVRREGNATSCEAVSRRLRTERYFGSLISSAPICRRPHIVTAGRLAAFSHFRHFASTRSHRSRRSPNFFRNSSSCLRSCQESGPKGEIAIPLKFEFDAMFDYGCVSLKRQADLVRLPGTRLSAVLEGYMSPEDMKEYLESF